MGSSEEAGLDRLEAQRSRVVSHGYDFPMNLIKRGLRSIGLLGMPATKETKTMLDHLTNLRISDVFNLPGESVKMEPEIFAAVCQGNKESLEKLKSNGTSLACLKSDQGGSVLHLAASFNHLELVKSIASEYPCLLLKQDSRNQLPLHVAAHGGYSTIVDALLETVGYISARLSDKEEKERLNLYVVKNKDGDTPLHLALKGNHMGSANYLVNANKEASFLANKDGISSLYLAVETGDLPLVKAMLETREVGRRYFAEIYSHLEGRKYLLHAALMARSSDTLKFLLEEYPSLVYERDEKGRTCLWHAASIGYYKGVRILLDQCTKAVYVCDDDGSFPIHVAVEERHVIVVTLLLTRCPDSKHLLNKKGQNIAHIAAKSGSESGSMGLVLFFHLWLSGWIDPLVQKQDKDGNSPLHEATIHWRPRTLLLLLLTSKKNWLPLQNNYGFTALDIAEKYMHPNYLSAERATLLVLIGVYPPKSKQAWWRERIAKPLEGAKISDTLLVVAALVATVTFAAGFTIPGGFSSSAPNLGLAALGDKPNLKYFMIFNILAMISSIWTIALLIWGRRLGDQALLPLDINSVTQLLFFSLICMLMAFYWGVVTTFVHVKVVVVFLKVTYAFFFYEMFVDLGPTVYLQTVGIPVSFGKFLVLLVLLLDEDRYTATPVKMISDMEDSTVE